MTKEPLVSVVIANWNGKSYLRECLSSLKNQTYPHLEIIVVDNGSSDDSLEFMETNFPKIVVIKNRSNLGFAKANNLGILAARGKYIATLNNDAVAEPDWIENLLAAAQKRNDVAMFASKILSFSNPKLIESAGLLLYPDGIAGRRGYLEKNNSKYTKEEEVLLPTACAALYRKEQLLACGLFDKDYFAYCEDTDLGLRMRLLGMTCLYVPDAMVYHHYSGTSRANLSSKVYLVERNRLWTALKCFPAFPLFTSCLYTLKRYLFYLYAAFLKIGPAKEFCEKEAALEIFFILFRVYLSTFLNLSRLIQKRRHILAHKKIGDREIKIWFKKYRVRAKELVLYPNCRHPASAIY